MDRLRDGQSRVPHAVTATIQAITQTGRTALGSIPLCAETRSMELRGLPVVELEQAAEALTTFDRACSDHRCRRGDDASLGCDHSSPPPRRPPAPLRAPPRVTTALAAARPGRLDLHRSSATVHCCVHGDAYSRLRTLTPRVGRPSSSLRRLRRDSDGVLVGTPATCFIWSSAGPRRRYQPGENRRVPRNTLSVVPPQWSAVSADHSSLSMLSRGRGRAC